MKVIKSGMLGISIMLGLKLFLLTRKRFCFFLVIIRRILPKRRKPCSTRRILIGKNYLVVSAKHYSP